MKRNRISIMFVLGGVTLLMLNFVGEYPTLEEQRNDWIHTAKCGQPNDTNQHDNPDVKEPDFFRGNLGIIGNGKLGNIFISWVISCLVPYNQRAINNLQLRNKFDTTPLLQTEKIRPPFEIRLCPIKPPPKGGSFQVKLTITPRFQCEKIQVSIKTFGNLEIYYKKTWEDKLLSKDSLNYSFKISIPDQDTTGFEVYVQSEKIWHHAFLYFVTTGDKVQVFHGNPRNKPIFPPTKIILKKRKKINQN